MRKIEQEMNQAIISEYNWSKDNTQVIHEDNITKVFLHGHNIATLDRVRSSLTLSSCGWQTNTTKSRLNAILSGVGKSHCGIYQKSGVWYFKELFEKGKGEKFFDNFTLTLY